MREMIRPLRQLRMTRKSDSQPRAMTACRELDPGKRSVALERLASRLAHQVGGAPGDDDVANALKYALSSARGGAVSSFLELVLAATLRLPGSSSRHAVIALGCESDFLVIRSWRSGRIISRMRRGAFCQQFGAPNLTVQRADLLDVMRGARRRPGAPAGSRGARVRKFSPKHRRNSSSSNILSGCCEIIS